MPGRTILVIDYDPQSIDSTRKSLVEAGYQVEVATDGIEGLKTFERARPDLVLIEPMVPKKHGFQVCREIKGSAHGRTTPVLITTAFYKGRKHRAQARESYGCDDYLEKPIAQNELLEACRRWVEGRGAAPVARPAASSGSVALDDLSDEEIIARLDAMIDAATAPVEEAPSAPPVPKVTAPPPPVPSAAPRKMTAPPQQPPASPKPVDTRAALHVPPKVQAPPRPEARVRSAEAAVLASGTTRAVVPRVTVERAPKRRATYVALALVVLAVLGSAAWIFRPAERAPEPTPKRDVAPVEVIARPAPPVASPPIEIPSPSVAPTSPPTLTVREEPEARPTPAPQRTEPPTQSAAAKRPRPSVEPAPSPSSAPAPALAAPELAPADPQADLAPEAKEPDRPEVAADSAAVPERPAVEPGALVELSEVDVPPVALRKDPPAYPSMARSLRQQGTVILRLLVDDRGAVERAEVVPGSDGRLLEEAALRAVKGWRYRPASVGDVPVKVWITEHVVFRL
jgi:protein TonB